MPRQSSAQVVGNIGLYYAAYRLSEYGWNVMPTARNARGVDLLAYDVGANISASGYNIAADEAAICADKFA